MRIVRAHKIVELVVFLKLRRAIFRNSKCGITAIGQAARGYDILSVCLR
jgi:hypothetical protein